MYIFIIIKTIVLYFYIVICYRLMGKKDVGKLSIIDLIVSVLIAGIAAFSIEEAERSILYSLVPITVLVIIQILLSYGTLKNKSFRKIVDGKPSVIINDGKLQFSVMSKLRYSLDDLLIQLRESGVASIEDVNYAVLENNGKLSVFKENKDYPLPVIVDGKIEYEVLLAIKKDYKWIDRILSERNIKLENVFYAFYTKNKTFIIKKSDLL